jgi:hypothetical protein
MGKGKALLADVTMDLVDFIVTSQQLHVITVKLNVLVQTHTVVTMIKRNAGVKKIGLVRLVTRIKAWRRLE